MKEGVTAQSLSNIEQYLHDVEFPANKEELLEQARQSGADDSVLEILENLPDRQFASMSDVTKAFEAGSTR
jgi:hypothetical protein